MSYGERRHGFGATIVTCYDAPHCPNEFRSASDPSVIVKQLKVAGWQVVRTHQGTSYRCPTHNRVAAGPAGHRDIALEREASVSR